MENTGSKKIILVIDDLTVTLMAIRSMLEDTYEVSVAKSAIDGWVVLKSIPVNLILLDIEMPGISGMEFMANLQKSPYRSAGRTLQVHLPHLSPIQNFLL
jgi:CheY-like chemotaxis protein